MTILTLLLVSLVLLALAALWSDVRGDGYGRRRPPLSRYVDQPPWPRL